MKLPSPVPVTEIAREISAEIIGNRELVITGINEIHKVREGDITFADVEKYFNKALQSQASAVILNKEFECPEGKAILVCDNPFEAYDSLVSKHARPVTLSTAIDPSAKIAPSAVIEPNAIIGPHVTIGADTHIEANVVVRAHTHIGERVQIQSGAVIGTDAFYFKKSGGRFVKWTTGGRVVIEDDVYVGANCTINRGVSGDTVIGEGTKLDCLVHIGHGVVIGKHCIIAGQVGISGKTIIGDRCTIYGQAGLAPSLNIGDDVTIHPQAGVGNDLESGKGYFGTPAVELMTKWRQIAALKKLPDLIRRLK